RITLVEQHHVMMDGATGQERDVFGFRTDDNIMGLMTSTYAEYDPEGFNDIFRRCKKHTNRKG
ncbi:MAG: hypothetical protein LPK09_00730, partial [Hymenobacteraceae bacterium]|nr:hypothetical protein [Hymenobacteraceae bacterium]